MGVARRNLYLDRGDMVTTTTESMQMVGILLRYLSKSKALKMITDMEEEVASTTQNISLRDSIIMTREYLQ